MGLTARQFNGQQFTLSWDSAHRVTQTWNAASSVVESYRYDAHGHRMRTVRSGETVYQVYTQDGDLLMERTNAGTTRKYARLGGRLIGETVNGARLAIHTDVIGSVRQKTDAFGTLVHEDVRAPYGSTLVGWQYQNGPAFTGHMEDGATGLTYTKQRVRSCFATCHNDGVYLRSTQCWKSPLNRGAPSATGLSS